MHILCPHCRNPIEVVKLTPNEEVACPSCGSSFHLDCGPTTGHDRGAGEKLGKFELIDLVGHGAFGAVYKARDPELDRVVALKVPRAGQLAGPKEVERFLREARSAAQLRHPSIVSVHDVGTAEGVPYLVSDFVQGVTLADLLSAKRPPFREAAELVAAIAEALQYAHGRGVVHRDVKPSNIMIGNDGRPVVMDFGLAKRDAGEITMTVEGQVLGTPAYMPPEQARGEGHRVDARGDVYSLGVILYQMLTGELPFRGTTRMLLHQVLHDDPRPPRRLNDRIPRDLETITLKAMAKEPGRRYQTAKELGDDLGRHLRGEAIVARPAGRLERLGKWVRRRPAVAALYAVIVVAGALLGVGGWWSSATQSGLVSRLETANGQLATVNGELAVTNTRLEGALKDVTTQRNRAVEQQRSALLRRYVAEMSLAYLETERRKITQARDLLEGYLSPPGDAELRGFEWYHLWKVCHSDGYTLQTSGLGHGMAITGAVFSPKRNDLAVGFMSGVHVRDMTGRQWRGPFLRHERLRCLAYSPDGALLATGGPDGDKEGVVKLWAQPGGALQATLEAHAEEVKDLLFTPDGKSLVTASKDKTVKVWEVASRKLVHTLPHDEGCLALSQTAKGETLAVASGHVHLWDMKTGQRRSVLKTAPYQAYRVAYSPNGQWLAVGTQNGPVQVWSARQGRLSQTLRDHTGGVVPVGVTFSPDSRGLATGGWDRKVCLYQLIGGMVFTRGTHKGHRAPILQLAYSPDGSRLVSAGADGTVKFWRPTALAAPESVTPLPASFSATADRRDLVGKMEDDTLTLLSLTDWGKRLVLKNHSWKGKGKRLVTRSSDGRLVAGTEGANAIKLWDARSGQPLYEVENGEPVGDLALSPDGQVLAVSNQLKKGDGLSRPPAVNLWKGRGPRPYRRLEGHTKDISQLVFSPDGRHLATTSLDRTIRLWDVEKGKQVRMMEGPKEEGLYLALAFFAGGKQLVVGGDQVLFWDVSTGKLLRSFRGHTGPVVDLAFSPDGRTLVTASADRTIKLWNVASGAEVMSWPCTPFTPRAVGFSADGKTLAAIARPLGGSSREKAGGPSNGFAGEYLVWRAAGEKEIAEQLDLEAKEGKPQYGQIFATD